MTLFEIIWPALAFQALVTLGLTLFALWVMLGVEPGADAAPGAMPSAMPSAKPGAKPGAMPGAGEDGGEGEMSPGTARLDPTSLEAAPDAPVRFVVISGGGALKCAHVGGAIAAPRGAGARPALSLVAGGLG